MIPTNQFKNGMTIVYNDQVYTIVYFQHVKPGKGGAFIRTKLKNLNSGAVIDQTFRAGEKIEQAFVEQRKIQFLYRKGNSYFFMDQHSFDELELSKERLAGKTEFIKEGMLLSVTMCNQTIVNVNLPNFIELKVTHSEPGLRADTVKAATKTVMMETGAKIDVPLFVKQGDILKIDTRSKTYVSRV